MTSIIHMGHHKTGSSAIQHQLSIHTAELEALGWSYPYHPQVSLSQKGHVSSGNGALLLQDNYAATDATIYSNEGLFNTLANDAALDQLKSHQHPFRYIVYTRNIFDMSYSSWSQSVKRKGYANSYDAHIRHNMFAYLEILQFWIRRRDDAGLDLHVFNYSNYKSDLWSHFKTRALGLGVSACVDADNDKKVVNRSLTLSEYRIQKEFNKRFPGNAAKFVSDAFVNQLPHLTPQRPQISLEAYEIALEKVLPVVQTINSSLEAAEHIQIETFEEICQKSTGSLDEAAIVSDEQLETLAECIAVKFEKFNVRDPLSIRLQDVAYKLDKGQPLDERDAYILRRALALTDT